MKLSMVCFRSFLFQLVLGMPIQAPCCGSLHVDSRRLVVTITCLLLAGMKWPFSVGLSLLTLEARAFLFPPPYTSPFLFFPDSLLHFLRLAGGPFFKSFGPFFLLSFQNRLQSVS